MCDTKIVNKNIKIVNPHTNKHDVAEGNTLHASCLLVWESKKTLKIFILKCFCFDLAIK